jgi:predicted GH43/DUF377 family glycosyl hydrolase
MLFQRYSCLLLITLFGLSLSGVYAQTDWTKFNGNPIMNIGTEGEWDDLFLSSVDILFHENKYKMWYGAGNDFAFAEIGYAESADGISWTRYPINPVLKRGSGTEWDRNTIGAPCVLINDNKYRMYYSARNGIGLALSNDGISWEKHPDNPIMGADEAWGLHMITMPCVLKIESLYHMWYSCYDGQGTNTFQIGYATSSDGVIWEKYDENPVFKYGDSDAWDQGAHANSIIFSDSVYHMWYSAYSDDRGWLLGYATSPDGINWERSPENPIINRVAPWDVLAIQGCSVMDHENVMHMWYTGVDGLGEGRFGLATLPVLEHEIALLPISAHLENVPILVNNYMPQVNVFNYGKHKEEAINVNCCISTNETEIYTENIVLTVLEPAGRELYTPVFPPFSIKEKKQYKMKFKSNFPADEYSKNDTISTTIDVINIMDDFENGIHLWDVNPPWSTSDEHSSAGYYSLKSGGNGKYKDNLDACAVYRYFFDFSQQEAAYLQFQTRHFIQANVDFGYVEVSADSGETWYHVGDVFTGIKPRWGVVQIPLNSFCGEGFEIVMVRFRFVSDASGTQAGWFIDDVEIYKGEIETSVENSIHVAPKDFKLHNNYPNPFNPDTQISYDVPGNSHIRIEIFNSLGQQVKTLVSLNQNPGHYEIVWDGTNDQGEKLGTGIYLCKMQGDGFSETTKLLLVK